MKIVIISDTHSHEIETPECDVLIHCGDATNKGTTKEYHTFIEWFSKAKAKHKIYVPGNHDFGVQDILITQMIKESGINFLLDDKLIIDSVVFYGTPWCPKYGNWNFMPNDQMIRKYRDAIPDDVNVLITHSPPHSILDLTLGSENAGCDHLYNKIKKLDKLKVNCFGHIHEAYGQLKIDDVLFINAAIMNFFTKTINKPVVIEL
jgi:Icc-related predicted phosphoesterase